LEHHLLNIAVQRRLPNDWPAERIIVAMVEQAQGLFVWAAAACRFAQEGKRRRKQLFSRNCYMMTMDMTRPSPDADDNRNGS
jgi:hypothetical protein